MANWDKRADWYIRISAQRNEIFRPATDMMLAMADIKTGYRVLDVAAGAGGQTLLAAGRVGPNGYVLAIDHSSKMLFSNVPTRSILFNQHEDGQATRCYDST